MRFGIKTSPQNTTWADMLAVWQAADGIEVFESGWTFDHFHPIFSDPTGPCMAATLDIISNGRLELGLGAGWNEEECAAYGIVQPPHNPRVLEPLAEALQPLT